MDIESIVEILEKNYEKPDISLVKKAFSFASKKHKGQNRLSGEPYIIYPVAVAEI